MNKSKLYSNEKDPKVRMAKKSLKGIESRYLYQQGVPSFSVAQS